MMEQFKDWRYAVMWVTAGFVASVVLHLLPEPLHVPFSWGFPVGWATTSLIMWFVTRYRNRG